MVKIFTCVPPYSENFITIMNISFKHQLQFWKEMDSAIHVQNPTQFVLFHKNLNGESMNLPFP